MVRLALAAVLACLSLIAAPHAALGSAAIGRVAAVRPITATTSERDQFREETLEREAGLAARRGVRVWEHESEARTLAAEGSGTVWDSISATQGVYEGTTMPRSMSMTLENGQDIWIHPNVTEHFVERMAGASSGPLADLSGQAQLTGLRAALGQADLSPGMFGQMQTAGRAEFMFSMREGATSSQR